MREVFEITGGGTTLLAWVLAVVSLVVVVRTWPRLAPPGARSVFLRVLALMLVVVTLVSAVGVTANRAGLWFVSWRDLASVLTGPTGGDLTTHGAAPGVAAAVDQGPWGPATAPVVPSPPPAPDGRTPLAAYTVTGPASGITGTVYVWSPPQRRPGPRPVLQVFHGYPVSAQSAFANLDLEQAVPARLGDAIVLVPDWSPGEVDTECVDGPAGRMETWLTTDVPAWAAATLGARPDRGSWATLGYSAGGWCAMMAAMRHPDTYAAAVSLGGYARPEFSGHYEPFPSTGGPYDLPLLAGTDPPGVALLVQFSDRDAYAAPSDEALVAATRAPLSVTQWSTPDAGHRVGAWKPLVPDALRWLSRTAPGFAA